MSEQKATSIAEALGGVAVRCEDGIEGEPTWVVRFERADGRWVVLSEKSIDEFYDLDDLDKGHCYLSINLV